ncbi:MAG TPA: c-type cytochrome [Pseudomonadaceae bacterium]|nr:c-type cytochrome [Pseudomonadaceae bacterium]
MNKKPLPLIIVALVVIGVLYWVFAAPSVGNPEIPSDAASIARGEYLYNAGGCASCHQPDDAQGPIGGYQIESPMGGSFFVPNITQDPEVGIGGWTGRDYIRAIKHGRSPSGGFYWPAFPFRTYSNLSDAEVLDLAAYMQTMDAIPSDIPAHDLPAWQFSWMMAGWNILAGFMEGEAPAVGDDPLVQRGAYLARSLGHCSECHTPRNVFGMLQLGDEFAGATGVAPAINAEALAGYSAEDFLYFLQEGMNLDFEVMAGQMGKVIEHTSQLSPEDQDAYVAFFLRETE